MTTAKCRVFASGTFRTGLRNQAPRTKHPFKFDPSRDAPRDAPRTLSGTLPGTPRDNNNNALPVTSTWTLSGTFQGRSRNAPERSQIEQKCLFEITPQTAPKIIGLGNPKSTTFSRENHVLDPPRDIQKNTPRDAPRDPPGLPPGRFQGRSQGRSRTLSGTLQGRSRDAPGRSPGERNRFIEIPSQTAPKKHCLGSKNQGFFLEKTAF